MAERKISYVTGRIVFDDGHQVKFDLNENGSSRWGETTPVLADAVEPCEAMANALREADLTDWGQWDD